MTLLPKTWLQERLVEAEAMMMANVARMLVMVL